MFPLKDDIPTRRLPVITLALIALNVVAFFGFQGAYFHDAQFNARVADWGAVPYDLTHSPGAHTLLTAIAAMFMHGGILHLAGNMLFLWVFGNNIEDSMGRLRFVAFYLVGGLAALALQVAVEPSSTVPTIGASGAVAAVLGAYALLYPRARVVTLVFIIVFFTVITVPALLVLGAWFVMQALYGFFSVAQPMDGGGGVAYFAHIGGFVFGLLAIKLFADRVHRDYRAPHQVPAYR
ncbi:MAG: rhomboid family intramembrane serine protease [Thermoleophilaceae bacterium]